MLSKNKHRAKLSKAFCVENGFYPNPLLNSYNRRQFRRNKNSIISKFKLKPLPKDMSNYKEPKDMSNFVIEKEVTK
jgi:hypothetical protein